MQSADYHVGLNAHLLSSQTGYRQAGISGYIAHLLQALPAIDPAFTYTVFTGPQAGRLPEGPVRVRRSRWRTERPARRILWEQIVLPWALTRTRPDLQHGLAFVTPVLSHVPSVVTVYDLSFVHYPDRLPAARRWYLRVVTSAACRRARRVIAISDSTARDLVMVFGLSRDRIDVAPPGVSEQFRPLPAADVARFRQQHDLPQRFLLFLGTLEPRKNLPVLLRAYAQLPAADRQAVHLVLAGGKGWMADDIFKTIEDHRLGDVVHLPGYIAPEDLVQWYNAAETFVYPSVFEGFGLPVIEAMACGTPVIVSDVSSLPEAAGDAGRRLPPDDVAAWADALAQAIHDPAWREQAAQAGRTHAARFTWQHTAARTVASYRKALHLEQVMQDA